MKFTKMEGCGNDYVYVNGFSEEINNPNDVAVKVSDRHFGIGSDGLIIINPSNVADFKMSMYNADGSEGKMCGNGIRCVAKYVYDNNMTDKDVITVETLSGIKTLQLKISDGKVEMVRVNMGKPEMMAKKIPVISDEKKMIAKPIIIDGLEYKITCVSMGNPHAVTFIDDISKLEIEKVGPLFENNPIFPDRINTEFVQIIDKKTVNMRVWERGSGETLACGTGACASVVACVLNGYTENIVNVKLLGGDLLIEYNEEEDTVYMTGPAKVAFTGDIILQKPEVNMKLSKLLERVEYTLLQGDVDVSIDNLAYDSRKAGKNDVFVCIKGAGFDGHQFITQAVEKGAAAVIVMDDIKVEGNITVIKVKNTRIALAYMSAAYFDYPAEKITTVGITGTKGKTTTTYMVRSVLESVGIKTSLIGTIETIIGEERTPALNTTPESYVIQESFARMVEAGCECVVMEVSSQGLMLHRVAGFTFDYGIFTNIEPDHIGPNEHKDFMDYLMCKSMLLKQCRHGIVNADADYITEVLKEHTCTLETYGVENKSDLNAKNIKLFTKPGCLCVSYDLAGVCEFPVEIHIPGMFSVYNSLCAIAICRHFTNDEDKIRKALIDVSVKGRVEIIPVSGRFTLMIDYAHNAMSLESLLTSLRQYNPKRLVTLFGCGGNRSKERRFEMGEVSSRLSDFTIVTSDNPRFEEPIEIINDILVGIKKSDGEYVTVPDRKDAIRYAILHAEDGDVIVLAGKGHEDYQEIRGVKHEMDERKLISEIINEEEVKKIL